MRLSSITLLTVPSVTFAFSPHGTSITTTPSFNARQHLYTTKSNKQINYNDLSLSRLHMMKKEDEALLSRSRRQFEDNNVKVDGSLSASSVASGNYAQQPNMNRNILQNFLEGAPEVASFLPVLSAALLITSNTVGASMMVLPGLAQGPGMITSSALILAIYIINLISGLLIAEVAINQYETSSCDVPSSFKEFASFNLQSQNAGTMISCISMFVNSCVLSYDLVTAGHLTNRAIASTSASNPLLSSSPDLVNAITSSGNAGIFAAATFFVALISTQSSATLSGVASICCLTLFACFAGLVIPGLSMIHDPLSTFAAQGTSEFGSEIFMNDISTFVPVLLAAMIYQNIVPTITKMLNYDRTKTVMAIVGGSAMPMLMYIAFCFTVLGGGAIDGGDGIGSIFLTGIGASSVFGSAMACIMSISQELDIYLKPDDNIEDCEISEISSKGFSPPAPPADGTASFSSVLLVMIAPVLAGVFFADGDCFVKALAVSGSYGSPLLYGIVPVLLAFTQRTTIMNELGGDTMANAKAIFKKVIKNDTDEDKQLMPGGMLSMGALAACATTLMSTHLFDDLSIMASSASL